MKKLYFVSLLISVIFSIALAKADVTVNVATAGTLEDVLFNQTQEEFTDIIVLTITGSLNADDIMVLNNMSKDYALRTLDLSDANIAENSLAAQAFKSSKLEHITLPKTLESMGTECFHSAAIKTINIPTTNLKTIPLTCFTWCTALEELTLPEGVETLGQQSLVFCTSLRKLTLPSTLTHIGENAILGDYNFTYTAGFDIPLVEINAKMTTIPTMDAIALALSGYYWTVCELKVPIGTKSLYEADKHGEPGAEWWGFGMIQNITESDFTASVKNTSETAIKVFSHEKGKITVAGVEIGTNVSIYNANGILFKTQKMTSTKDVINLNQSGLYILVAGNNSVKFSVL